MIFQLWWHFSFGDISVLLTFKFWWHLSFGLVWSGLWFRIFVSFLVFVSFFLFLSPSVFLSPGFLPFSWFVSISLFVELTNYSDSYLYRNWLRKFIHIPICGKNYYSLITVIFVSFLIFVMALEKKSACCAGFRRRPFQMQIHPFTKLAMNQFCNLAVHWDLECPKNV